jgi:hypothetical protein
MKRSAVYQSNSKDKNKELPLLTLLDPYTFFLISTALLSLYFSLTKGR